MQVFGQRELVEHLESGGDHYRHCISIGNPGRGFGRPDTVMPPEIRRHFRRVLRLAFYDVEEMRHLGTMRPRRIPRKSDVRRVIRFFNRTCREADGIHQRRLERMRRELDLTEDALLEELPAADGE